MRTGTLAILIPALFLLQDCSHMRHGEWMKISGFTQGTTYNITYFDPDSVDYRYEIDSLLHDFDLALSTYVPESEISGINRGDTGIRPGPLLIRCFRAAGQVFEESGGAFDISVAPLVNAWGFGFTERALVDSNMIDSLMQYVGMDKLFLEDGRIMKEREGVMMDMNAIAQGLSVDVLAGFLESRGIDHYLVDVGGEMRTLGVNNRGTAWRVGIDKPIEGLQVPGVALEAVISVSGRSLATSGNYRRFYEMDGMKYSHTIDPSTGYPVNHGLLSATVLCRECMFADAYATAFMVMGTERAISFLDAHPELDAFLIYNTSEGEYRVWATPGLENYLGPGS
jgi:thiamine biosynthesis lipoprotein